jgi:hypothetical protein
MARSYDSKGRGGMPTKTPRRSGPCPRHFSSLDTFPVSFRALARNPQSGRSAGNGGIRQKKAVFAGMARSYDSKGRGGMPTKTPRRSGPCPRHGTSDFDGALPLRELTFDAFVKNPNCHPERSEGSLRKTKCIILHFACCAGKFFCFSKMAEYKS